MHQKGTSLSAGYMWAGPNRECKGRLKETMLKFLISVMAILDCGAMLFPPQYQPDLVIQDESRRLRDGLLVSRGEDVLIEEATWMVIVALHKPTVPSELEDRLVVVEGALRKICANLSKVEYGSWRTRLSQVKLKLTPDYLLGDRHHFKLRNKRGLFDFVGLLSHHLFGTATVSEVRKLREILWKTMKDNQAINHVLSEFTTVINQTQVHVQENRDMINKLSAKVGHIIRYIGKIDELTQVVNANLQRHYAERLVEDIELLASAYTDVVERYHRQRAAMEMGVLTEDMLPPTVLQEVVTQARSRQRDMISSWEWYYQYVRVKPLWGQANMIVYQIELPLVKPVKYIHYVLEAFPVPQEGNTSATVKVERNVALDQAAGGLFIPRNCMGHKPVVCQPSPVRVGEAMSCERGIITGKRKERENCVIKIGHSTLVDQLWFVGKNRAVLSTWGGALRKHCEGYPEQTTRVERGVYVFNISENCMYLSSTWQVEYSPGYSQSIYVEQQPLPNLPPVEFPSLLNHTSVKKRVMADLKELGSTKYLTISKLSELASPTKPFYGRGVFWAICCSTMLGLGVCITLVIFGCKRYVHQRMGKLRKVPNEERGKVPDEEIELSVMSPTVNDNSQNCESAPKFFAFNDSLFAKKFRATCQGTSQ